MIPSLYMTIQSVLEVEVLFLELMQRGEERGNVKVAGLLHQELTALFPLPFQELFEGLRLT